MQGAGIVYCDNLQQILRSYQGNIVDQWVIVLICVVYKAHGHSAQQHLVYG